MGKTHDDRSDQWEDEARAEERVGKPTNATPKERPILFSGAMVRAILEGRKAQTRRVVATKQPLEFLGGRGQESDLSAWGWFFDGPQHHGYMVLARGMDERHDHGCISIPCPYGEPGCGDTLWARETWALEDCGADGKRVIWQADRAAAWVLPEDVLGEFYYLPSDYEPKRWRPSIHMPRWASRLTLDVTDVRVQRLQEISEEDARAEGVFGGRDDLDRTVYTDTMKPVTAVDAFRVLWDSINGGRPGCSWEANPFVWAISFKKVEG